jgi:hypothetical protein
MITTIIAGEVVNAGSGRPPIGGNVPEQPIEEDHSDGTIYTYRDVWYELENDVFTFYEVYYGANPLGQLLITDPDEIAALTAIAIEMENNK